jgi:ABC-type bacteriocin/lantibiotic exporter with double-glycine peptidase domain
MSPLGRFFRLLHEFGPEIRQLYSFALLNGLISLSLPLGLQAVIQFLMTGQLSTSLYVLVFLVVGGLLFSGWMNIMQLITSEHIRKHIVVRGAFDFIHRLPRLQLEKIARTHVPELMNRFFDIISIEKGMQKLLMEFSTATLQLLLGLMLLSLYHPIFIVLAFIIFFLIYLVIRYTGERGLKLSLESSKHKYDLVFRMQIMAGLLNTLKLMPIHTPGRDYIDRQLGQYLESREKHFAILKIQYWGLVLMKALTAFFLLIIGAVLLKEERINLGQFVAAEIIILLIMSATEKIIFQIDAVYDLLTSIEKVGHITELPMHEEATYSEGGLSRLLEGPIQFEIRSLRFQYDDSTEPLINDLNLDLKPGEKVAISGRNGSGRSTLIKLITRLYEPPPQSVFVNGFALEHINHRELYVRMGHCLQSEEVMMGTLFENIDLGRGYSAVDIQAVIARVGLEEATRKLPQGMYTFLSSDAKPLSPSLGKRVILARCLLSQPALIVYEDVFSGMTADEKNPLYELLAGGPWTLLACTNDQNLTEKCDRKLWMDSGRILDSQPFNATIH